MSATSTLHNSLWRQGAILPRELLNPSTIPDDLDPNAKLILVSHDCDIVQRSYDLEPYVEFLVARPATKPDGAKTKGKNPRCLQLPLVLNGEERLYEVSIHEKYRDQRSILERGNPDASCRLSQRDIRTIGRWVGKRYSRPAFPTTFNSRVSGGFKKFRKALEQYGAEVSGIFIYLESDRELPETEPYRIIVRIVAPRAILEDDREEQTLLKLVAALQAAFGGCPGIEMIEGIKLDSDAEFSLQDWNNTKVWDLEFLSTSEDDNHTYLAGSGL